MKTWEYMEVTIKDEDNTIENLDGFGSEGWEVYFVRLNPGRSETFYLKREVSKNGKG